MATVYTDASGRRRLQFFDRDRKRRTLSLGKACRSDALIKAAIDELVRERNQAITHAKETATWAATISAYPAVPSQRSRIERRLIPDASGVYFLYDPTLLYVGSAECLRSRLCGSHEHVSASTTAAWLFYPASEMIFSESFYVGTLRPPKNKMAPKATLRISYGALALPRELAEIVSSLPPAVQDVLMKLIGDFCSAVSVPSVANQPLTTNH